MIVPLLDRYRAASGPGSAVAGWCLYLVLFCAALALLPPAVLMPESNAFIVTLGLIGAWRYGWAANHVVRTLLYRHVAFPPIRRRAEAVTGTPPRTSTFW